MTPIPAKAWALFASLLTIACQSPRVDVPDSDLSFEYEVRYTGDASKNDELPMLLALHGDGDSPGHFFDTTLDRLDEPARVILLRGPRDLGMSGGAWPSRIAELRECGDAIASAAGVLVEKFPTVNDPVVFGFSGGAVMAYYIAAAHPDRFPYVVPVAGKLTPQTLAGIPAPSDPWVEVHAFHGTKDQVVGIGAGRVAVQLLGERGIDATLTEIHGGHHIVFLEGKRRITQQLAWDLQSIAG